MAQHPDVLILGGGVTGLTTACFLRRAQARVTVLDRAEPAQESSWAGAGILPPAPTIHQARTGMELLAAHSALLFARLSAELRETTALDNGYHCRGGIELLEAEERSGIEGIWQRQGIVYEALSAERLGVLEPAVRPGPLHPYYLPAMAQVRNPRHLKALLAACGQQGVVIHSHCPVLGWEKSGARITGVMTERGRFSAERYLIAAGAWSEGLLAQLGWCPGIHPVRGQIALLQTQPPLLARIVEQGKRYLVPRPDGRVLIGSTEEATGFDKRTTAQGIQSLLRFALNLVPALAHAPLERCWAGLRPGSPDEKPFLGSVPGWENVFVAAGHYRAGIQLSPGTALVMSELLCGLPPSFPLDEFRLDRHGIVQATFTR